MNTKCGLALGDAVDHMRQELTTAIEVAMARFEAETGLTPARIDVELCEATTIGNPLPRRVLGAIRIDIGEL